MQFFQELLCVSSFETYFILLVGNEYCFYLYWLFCSVNFLRQVDGKYLLNSLR